MTRQETYAALRQAGFSREFSRRHDKANSLELSRLLGDVRTFSTSFAEKEARHRATEARFHKPTDVPWYKATSEKMSKALDRERRAYKAGRMTAEEYSLVKARFAQARTILQQKALHGPTFPRKADYYYVDDLFDDYFPDDDWSELYGSDEDRD